MANSESILRLSSMFAFAQSVDEFSVTQTFLTAGCIDTDNPKLTEFSAALAAVSVGIDFTTIYSVLSVAEETGLFPKYPRAFFKTFCGVYGWRERCVRVA